MKSTDHIMLNEYILASGALFWLYFIVWTVYNLLTINFFSKSIYQGDYLFLYNLYLLPPSVRFVSLLSMQVQLLLPVICYALFVIYIALDLGLWQYLYYLPFFIVFTLVYSIFFYNRLLRRPDVGFKGISINLPFYRYFTKPAFSFYFFELVLKQTVVLFMSKTISCLLLAGSLFVFQTDNALDRRPLLLALLLAAAVNTPLVSLYHSYENRIHIYFRNLPLSIVWIFGKALAAFLIIMIPEMILIARILPKTMYATDLLFMVLYTPGLLAVYYGLQYLPQAANDTFGNRIFFGGFACFVFIMFGLPVYVFVVVCILTAFLLVKKLYYKYEYEVKNTGDAFHGTND